MMLRSISSSAWTGKAGEKFNKSLKDCINAIEDTKDIFKNNAAIFGALDAYISALSNLKIMLQEVFTALMPLKEIEIDFTIIKNIDDKIHELFEEKRDEVIDAFEVINDYGREVINNIKNAGDEIVEHTLDWVSFISDTGANTAGTLEDAAVAGNEVAEELYNRKLSILENEYNTVNKSKHRYTTAWHLANELYSNKFEYYEKELRGINFKIDAHTLKYKTIQNNLKKYGKKLGTVGLALTSIAIISEVLDEYFKNGFDAALKKTGEEIFDLGVSAAGTAAGTYVGIAVSGTIGSAVPVIGTTIGAAVGGFLDGILGGIAAEQMHENSKNNDDD